MQWVTNGHDSVRMGGVSKRALIRWSAALLAAIGLALLLGRSTLAASIPVTNMLDSGVGSLRDQIAAAASGDTITFNVTGVITLSSGEISINKNLSIIGPGASVLALSGNHTNGIFNVTFGNNVLISGLLLEYGSKTGFYTGGALYNGGILTMTDSAFFSNTVTFYGGALANGGTLLLARTVFTQNTATGTSSYGGAIENAGTMNITGSTFVSNTAALGAGIANYLGTLVVNRSKLVGNTAGNGGFFSDGGGLFNSGGTTTIINTLFEGNSATDASYGSGGGIENSTGTLFVIGSTFIKNTAAGSTGGGILNDNSSTMVVSNTTLTANHGEHGGGGISNYGTMTLAFSSLVSNTALYGGGGIWVNSTLPVLVKDTIVAGSKTTGGDCAGAFVSGNYNLSTDSTCPFTATHDISGTVALLGPLQNNGGPTLTIAPLPGSPAIDKGGDTCPAIDQRGVSRPQGAHCDIGAVELALRHTYMPIIRRAS